MSYFDLLPVELNTIIVGYLSYAELIFFNSAFTLNIDYKYLIRTYYNKYYNPKNMNGHQYEIYEGLKWSNNFQWNMQHCNYYAAKYFMMNKYCHVNTDIVSKMDDVELFVEFKSSFYGDYRIIIEHCSCNIIKYLIDNDKNFLYYYKFMLNKLPSLKINKIGIDKYNKFFDLILEVCSGNISILINILTCYNKDHPLDKFNHIVGMIEDANREQILSLILTLLEKRFYTGIEIILNKLINKLTISDIELLIDKIENYKYKSNKMDKIIELLESKIN